MPSKAAYLEHLAQVPFFAGCSKKDLQRIAKASDEVTVPAGTVLVDQGQMGKEAFVVVDGTATVRRNGRKIATVGPGAIIGELSLLDHGPRTATVTADTEMTVLVLTARAFQGLIEETPAISHRILAHLAGKVRELDRQIYG